MFTYHYTKEDVTYYARSLIAAADAEMVCIMYKKFIGII